jgi:hypothetical protein
MKQGVFLLGAALVGLMGCAAGNSTNVTGSGSGAGGSSSGSGVPITGVGGTGGASTSSTASASTSGSTTSTTSSSSATTSGTGGGSAMGLPVGTTCTTDSDCASQLCKPVVIGVPPVCVTNCTQQSDCVPSTGYFCEPVTAGSSNGYCIPQSPAHCLSCMQDSDCGSLSEVCFQAPGDNAMACNIDCSLAGAAACPSDYSCVPETVNGQARMLCRPTTVPTCLDAVGGFCDRLMIPQTCERINSAGDCFGERTCMPSERFSTCGAASPQCKTDCSMQDPAGCTETFCPDATDTAADCGTCGTVCPGYLQTADNVTCANGTTCTFSCQGENYDVDDNEADGCEVPDAPQGNHTQSTAANEGDVSDCDSGTTEFTITGLLVSDTRVHEDPAVVGFDTASGSAPDWYSIFGVGHTLCENDIVMTLAVQGSQSPACYAFTVITDENTYNCQTDATGTCGFDDDSGGQFSDNTTIYIEVSKTCSSASLTESVSYTVSGHL